MIKVDLISKSYDGNPVLQDIHLAFQQGEVHGVVGRNGSGKTTLFKCIAGLEMFIGSIAYDGGILKNQVGYLPTVPYFLSNMTGYEYLVLLCNARGVSRKDIALYNIFDLPLDKYAEIYSTGMQKKLAITGLLLQKNEVFILDEPFNGVDIASNLMIQEILNGLKALGKTVIISSHIFSTLYDSCDYLHYLKEGRLKYSLPKGRFDAIEEDMKKEGIGDTKINSFYSR
jgi:ABC-2 type transport system ATP-binding protein